MMPHAVRATLYALRLMPYALRLALCALLLAVLLSSCQSGPVGVARPVGASAPGGGIESAMRQAARIAVNELPIGKRVVVANFTRSSGGSVSQLGVELAKRFSTALWQESNRAGNRLVVIDRGAGMQAVAEEMRFVIDRMNPAELLQRFQADYAVCGEFELNRAGPGIRLDLRAVQTMGAELKFAGCCDLTVSDEQFYGWEQEDKLPLSTASDSMTAFFCAEGRWDAVEIVGMETQGGERIPANGRIRANTYMRLKVKVKQECYLYVLGWDQTNGYLTVLFPGKGESPRTGNDEFTLPTAGWIQAIPPPGYNMVKVVATRDDIDLTSTGSNLIEDPAAQNALVARIRRLGPDSWGSASYGYYIEE